MNLGLIGCGDLDGSASPDTVCRYRTVVADKGFKVIGKVVGRTCSAAGKPQTGNRNCSGNGGGHGQGLYAGVGGRGECQRTAGYGGPGNISFDGVVYFVVGNRR